MSWLKIRSCWVGSMLGCALTLSTVVRWNEAKGADTDAYQLVWSDEFERDGSPDPANWTYERGFVRNDELQWYQRENAFCKGGLLVIEARRERVANPEHDPESRHWRRRRSRAEYTSASVITRGRQQWLYGRFEMRGKIDTRPGLWPAFWTLGTARPWPGCGEIDIMEYYQDKLLANACWQGLPQVDWDATERPLKSFNDREWASKFHVWQMDWDAERIRLAVDGQMLNEIDVAAAVNADGAQSHSFREPHYLLLNLAVGGTRGGDPAPTEFPARFEIDYVRVYQRAGGATSSAARETQAQNAADDVRIVPIGPAYAANDINHVSFRQNSLTSVQAGDRTYQFAAYYRNVTGSSTCRVTVARRLLGSANWDIFNYAAGFNDPNSNATDSHNTISIAIDGDGSMHMSWGMHNNSLIYRKSTAPVLNSNAISFGDNLAMTGANENQVTYPQFYNLPDGDLLFFYRNGASGDGNTYLNRYDTATDSWSAVQHPLFDGLTSSVNAYFNTLAFDSQGALHATWTDRSTPAFQTNHNIYYARSPDAGASWTKMNGTPYAIPIREATAEVVVPIPEKSTLINQASMALDKHDRPLVATWWAPGTARGDFTRQYMLVYYDGANWQTSQISNRPHEPLQTDATVRDLARPLVLVDDDNRTIVVMRYDQRDDVVTVACSEDNQNWKFVDLTATGLGDWEPTHDAGLWKRENTLHLLYQPVGLGNGSSTISVLEWDAKAFF